MLLAIATEAALFIMLFFAYFYFAKGGWRWLDEEPPKLTLAIILLIVLLTSSAVLYWGEKQVKARRHGSARVALMGTILLGIAFLVIQTFEYADHLKSLTPHTNVYGSIFYTITSFHAAHVIVGLLILFYVFDLAKARAGGPATTPSLPQRCSLLAFRRCRVDLDRRVSLRRSEHPMSTQAQSPPNATGRIPQGRLWFGMCAGAVAWAIQGFTCFLISTQACKNGLGNLGSIPPGGVRILLGVISLILLAAAVAGGMTSFRNWREVSEHRHLTEAEGRGREAFMSLLGVFVSVAFVVGIIWAGLPAILIDVCINAR